MSEVLEQLAEHKPIKPLLWLKGFQAEGKSALAGTNWPTRKTEDWKYTNLKSLVSGGYFASAASVEQQEGSSEFKKTYQIDGLATYQIVFVNGVFSSELSFQEELPKGIECTRFSNASEPQIEAILTRLDSIVDNKKHVFSSINKHLMEEGVFVRIAKNTVLSKPLQIVWLSTHKDKAFQVSQRMLAIVEENAEATLIEQFVSSDGLQNNLTNGVTELHIEEGARAYHYRLHQESQGALHIGGFHASLKRNAFLNSFHMALGSKLKRIDVVINQDGEGANCLLNGVYLPQNDQHIDYHTCIEHKVPHGTTSENFRGIIAGDGRAVFNGRIHIHRDAQKTLAELSNKNLLTSNKAEIDSKPELEIYADDVKCAHGTTVAQLDDTALHYFKTRGVSDQKAKTMLSFGFIKELINEVQHPEMSEYLTPMLAQLFSANSALVGE